MVISPPVLIALRMSSGAIIWIVHFLAIYGFTALACTRGFGATQWMGIGVVAWAVGAATMLALAAAIVVIVVATRTHRAVAFTDWIMAGVAALAGLAILWEALLAAMVPACA